MARVAGVDLPKNKRIDVALQYLYGVGETRSKVVIAKLNGMVKPDTRVKDLTEEQVVLINNLLLKDLSRNKKFKNFHSFHNYNKIKSFQFVKLEHLFHNSLHYLLD